MLDLCNATATLYPLATAQDGDAGLDPAGAYPVATATGVWCVAQQTSEERVEDDKGRVSRVRGWHLGFPAETTPAAVFAAAVNDRLDLTTGDGRTHTLRVTDTADMGGRGLYWELSALEVL